MPNETPGILYGGGAMKAVGALPLWLLEHFRAAGDPARAYDESATTFRALEIRANTVASGDLKLYDKGGAEIESHELLDVLHNVNAEWNRSDLWRYTEAGGLVYGAGYWQKVRQGRRLKELFYLNPGTITPKLTPRGIVSFLQRPGPGQREQTFDRADVVYFRGAYDPHSDLTGKASLRWAINAALGEGATEQWLQAFFKNGAVPAFVLSTDKPMSDPEIEKARAWWEKLFRGVANAFRTGFLGNGLKPYPVGSSIKDMELASVRVELRRTISIVTGVPELLFSSTDSADLTPIDLAMKLFYYTTILPRWSWYAEVLNAELLSEYPDLVRSGAYLEFDTSDIEVLQEDATSKTDRVVALVAAGIITREKAAEVLGYKPEDVPPEAPAAAVPAQLQGAAADPNAPPAQTPPPPPPAAQRALAERDRIMWQRKALNAVARGKSAGVPFASDSLSANEHAEIAAALAECKTAADVHAVFSSEPSLTEIGLGLKAALDRYEAEMNP